MVTECTHYVPAHAQSCGVTRRNQQHGLCSQGAHNLMKLLGTPKQAGIVHDLRATVYDSHLSSFHIAVNKFITVLPLLENRAAQQDRNRKWEGNI